jgi:hypothetical protein
MRRRLGSETTRGTLLREERSNCRTLRPDYVTETSLHDTSTAPIWAHLERTKFHIRSNAKVKKGWCTSYISHYIIDFVVICFGKSLDRNLWTRFTRLRMDTDVNSLPFRALCGALSMSSLSIAMCSVAHKVVRVHGKNMNCRRIVTRLNREAIPTI